jgi:hypothetical protein
VVSLDFPHNNSLAVIPSWFQEDDIFLDICFISPSLAQAFQVTATVLATLSNSISAFTDGLMDPPSITTISASLDHPDSSWPPTVDHHLVTASLHASSLDSTAILDLLTVKDSNTSVTLDLLEIVYHPMIHWIPCLAERDRYYWLPIYHTGSCCMIEWIAHLDEHDTCMHWFDVLIGGNKHKRMIHACYALQPATIPSYCDHFL